MKMSMLFSVVVWTIFLVMSVLMYQLYIESKPKGEKYTYADYTKFPWCTCVRDINIV